MELPANDSYVSKRAYEPNTAACSSRVGIDFFFIDLLISLFLAEIKDTRPVSFSLAYITVPNASCDASVNATSVNELAHEPMHLGISRTGVSLACLTILPHSLNKSSEILVSHLIWGSLCNLCMNILALSNIGA